VPEAVVKWKEAKGLLDLRGVIDNAREGPVDLRDMKEVSSVEVREDLLDELGDAEDMSALDNRAFCWLQEELDLRTTILQCLLSLLNCLLRREQSGVDVLRKASDLTYS